MRTVRCLAVWSCWLLLTGQVLAQEDVAALAGKLSSNDAQARVEACQSLAKLGVKAQAAVPQLIAAEQAGDVELQRQAALALGEIGPGAAEAVPVLVAKLKAADPVVRSYAAHALGQIGPAAKSATEGLIAALADDDATVRRVARHALGKIKPDREIALPLFAKMLKTASPSEAAAAVSTLAEAGEAAVPALTAALDDADAAYWACLALSEIGPPAAPAVGKLGELLANPAPEVRMEALVALAAIGPASKPLSGRIAERLNKDDTDAVKYAAAYALGTIGDRTAALPALAKALDSKDEFLRVTAAHAYVRLVDNEKLPALQKAVKVVVDSIGSADHRVRGVALRAFADPDLPKEQLRKAFQGVLVNIQDDEKLTELVDALASLGPRVVPMCIRSLEVKGPLREYTLRLLTKIGPDAASAVPALTTTLADSDPAMRREALFALGAIGPAAAKATEKIMQALTDTDPDVRHTACYALGKIGPDARAALPALRTAMESDDQFLELAAVWAALKISPQDADLQQLAVPHLITGLTDERVHVRLECAGLLGELGAVARPAIAALQAAQQDEHDDVRAAATAALELLQK